MAFFANMTKREKSLVGIGGAAVLLLAAYTYFVYKPKAEELSVVQAHVDSLDKKNQQAKADIAKGSIQKPTRSSWMKVFTRAPPGKFPPGPAVRPRCGCQ